MNQDEIKNNLLNADQWIRVLFMALYAIAAWAVLIVLIVIVLIQVLINLVAGEPNWNLQKTGYLLGCYLQQIVQYLLYNEDHKPFPFGSDFPSDDGFTVVRPVRPSPGPAPSAAPDFKEPPATATPPEPPAPASDTVAPGAEPGFVRPAAPDVSAGQPGPAPETSGPEPASDVSAEPSGPEDEHKDLPPR